MTKVGIITLCGYKNYGNRLQNLATQEILKFLGFKVDTIINYPDRARANRVEISEGLFEKLKSRKRTKLVKKRKEAFKSFTKRYINETEFILREHDLPLGLSEFYDFFVVGSDQVWNPTFRRGFSVDFLTFAPKHKRISYAASIGISKIPYEYIERYKIWLSEFEFLSVREENAAKIIKELTGRDSDVLIDPTLMLDKKDWLQFSKQAAQKPKKNYLLTYFLGNSGEIFKKEIKMIAKQKSMSVVELANIKDKKRYIADPGEFIDYINSASVILTDSFHGVIFSILFEKEFVYFDRIDDIPSMDSRISTLLSLFKLENRKWTNIQNCEDIFNVDFSYIPSILEIERKKAINYLKTALSINDKGNFLT